MEVPSKIDVIVTVRKGRKKVEKVIPDCLILGINTKWPKVVTPDGAYVEFARETLANAAANGKPVRI